MAAYYNEIDKYAAAWLRNLIAAGLIAPGDVDERSIEDVRPDDLAGYRQCHFFAGIGVWSYALRNAGWPDNREVWTGSCPCQPFSAAGEGAGFADERHLWPAFFHLIAQRRPATVLGEQVASKDAEPWIDLVCDDLGSLGYACGAIAFPSAGLGAPHIRDRLYWSGVALGDTERARLEGHRQGLAAEVGRDGTVRSVAAAGEPRRLADMQGRGLGIIGSAMEPRDIRHVDGRGDAPGGLADTARSGHGEHERDAGAMGSTRDSGKGEESESRGLAQAAGDRVETGGLAHADGGNASAEREQRSGQQRQQPGDSGSGDERARPGPTNGFWRAADWLACRDERWRPVEPGTFPLAHGAAARVGRLRAYGNAVNEEAARIFIEAVLAA